MLQPRELFNLLLVAESVATDAASFVLRRANTCKPTALLSNDVKLDVDSATQNFLFRHLWKKTKVPVVGEEDFSIPLNDNIYWLVDPVDGSFNLWAGLPYAAVSIALMHRDEPLLGVVENIFSREQYSAHLGGGYRRNKKACSIKGSQDTGLVLTGLTPRMHSNDSKLNVFLENILSFRKVRMLGSASISLTHLVKGICDAVIFEDIHAWDVMAGCAIAKEAGCRIEWQLHDPNFMLGHLSAFRT